MNDLTKPLSDQELDKLHRILHRMDPDSAMAVSEIDGFFCALVSGPNQESLDEHIDYVMGPEFIDEEPVRSYLDGSSEARTLLIRHWNTIASTLMADKPYVPAFDVDEDGKPEGFLWVEGFMQGWDLDKAKWDRLQRDKTNWQLLAPILILLAQTHPDLDHEEKVRNVTPEQRMEILTAIVTSLNHLFRHFQADRRSAVPKNPSRVPQNSRFTF